MKIHDLLSGLMTESLAKWFGGFLGEFMEYDTRIPTMGIRHYMRIKVRIDIHLALKRRKKLQVGDQFSYARFQYEKISVLFHMWYAWSW